MPRLNYYDEIELEDMSYDEERDLFHYPCPCGDRFEISRKQLKEAEDVAKCPSCSLIIRVVFDPLDFEDDDEEKEEERLSTQVESISMAQARCVDNNLDYSQQISTDAIASKHTGDCQMLEYDTLVATCTAAKRQRSKCSTICNCFNTMLTDKIANDAV